MTGRQKLRRYLAKKKLTQDAFAAKAGVPGPQVSLWLNGERTPGLASAFAIEEATGGEVKASDWIASRRRPGGPRARGSRSRRVSVMARSISH